jgi:hypothetical protein
MYLSMTQFFINNPYHLTSHYHLTILFKEIQPLHVEKYLLNLEINHSSRVLVITGE